VSKRLRGGISSLRKNKPEYPRSSQQPNLIEYIAQVKELKLFPTLGTDLSYFSIKTNPDLSDPEHRLQPRPQRVASGQNAPQAQGRIWDLHPPHLIS